MNKEVEDIKILERAFEVFYSEYREQMDIRRTLEHKAQVAAGLAGVFLAAVFAFARDQQPSLLISYLILVALVCLLVSMWQSVRVLRVGEFLLPDDATAAIARAKVLIKEIPATIGERQIAFLVELLEGNDAVVDKLDEANKAKHKKLELAHRWLGGAVIAAAIVTAMRLLPWSC